MTRQRTIRELWCNGGTHTLLDPPAAIRDAASDIGFSPPRLEARDFQELEARVGRSYEEFVAPGGVRVQVPG